MTAKTKCPKCECEVPVEANGTFKTHGRYIIGSKRGFYPCAKSGKRVDGRRRTRLGHQIQNALAEAQEIARGEEQYARSVLQDDFPDPFRGFRDNPVEPHHPGPSVPVWWRPKS